MFIASVFIHKQGDEFKNKIKKLTVEHNERLYNDYKAKKISAATYSLHKRNVNSELRTAKVVNMVVSPFMAPSITLRLFLDYAMGC